MARAFLPPAQVAKIARQIDGGLRTEPYRLIGKGARVHDARGGWSESDETVEAGTCAVFAAGTSEGERAALSRLGWSSGVVVDLPLDTTVTPQHAIEVGNRRFEVAEVERGGALSFGVRALCQEEGGLR